MSYMKNFMMEVQEFVWDFFDQDGQFVADETIKDEDDFLWDDEKMYIFNPDEEKEE